MDLDELRTLLADCESDRSERTVSLTKTDKFGEAICAFANDLPRHGKPGYLFVNADPAGKAADGTIDERLLETLADIRSAGNVLPVPVMNVQKHLLGGGEMAVVEVFPSDLPPVRYRQRTWIRVGPSRRLATEAEERTLAERRTALARTWDARTCPGASMTDLELQLFSVGYRGLAVAPEVIEENNRTIEEQLAALRFYDLHARAPTNAGVVLFGKDPVFFWSGAYVQYVRYDGQTEADDPIEDRRFGGDLLTVLRGLDQLAEAIAVNRPVPRDGPSEKMVADYPAKAMHELFVNAVVHRDYESTTPTMIVQFSDRIEILNPGGLYGDLTPEQFGKMTAYRNPVLAEAARVLGFVNRYGRGVSLAQTLLNRNESRPAEFEIEHRNHMLVRVWRRA